MLEHHRLWIQQLFCFEAQIPSVLEKVVSGEQNVALVGGSPASAGFAVARVLSGGAAACFAATLL